MATHPFDDLIQDLLAKAPSGVPSVRIRRQAGMSDVTLLHQRSNVRGLAEEHKLPLIEGQNFVAISQYDIATDLAWILVDRI